MLSIGIVGLPNVGKSTLFKALTKKQIDIQNYPFTTIDPNVGVVAVPDERLEKLAKLSDSAKIVPTAIEFIDIAGLVKGAAQGEGLGNKFLSNIRETDAIAQVVRIFEDPNITHVNNKIYPVGDREGSQRDSISYGVDPADDIRIINTELVMADLDTVTKRLEKSVRDPQAKKDVPTLEKLKSALEQGKLVINIALDENEKEFIKELNLLTNKKFIYALNASENQIKSQWQPNEELLKEIGSNVWVIVSNTFELSLSELNRDEQGLFLEEVGLKESGLDALIKKGYEALDLITFLTTGPDETRAWTTKRDTPIPVASRAIHTDFEKLFIRAEVIQWQDLLAAGGWSNARQSGKLRTVGRDYVTQDGDVVEIKI